MREDASSFRLAIGLGAAVRAADMVAVVEFLGLGANPSSRGADGLTPLMIAAGLGQSQMVEILLTAGADVFAIEPRMGSSALHKGAQSGNGEVLGLLLDHGAFIDLQSPTLGNTPLMDAVLHKQEEAVRLLLDRGTRTTIRNHWQQTALELARADDLKAIALLIERRVQYDEARVRALELTAAIKAGDLPKVKRLISAGADVNERVPLVGSLDDDYTPLGVAARAGNATLVAALLNAGADPRRVIGLMKGTPIHEAAYFGHADVLKVFIAYQARCGSLALKFDAQGPYNGLTPLHDAVWHGHAEAAQTLVEAGAPLDIRTHAGLTPRDLAQLYGYENLALLLAGHEIASSGP